MEDPNLADQYVQEFVLEYLEDGSSAVGVKREDHSPIQAPKKPGQVNLLLCHESFSSQLVTYG